MTPSKPTSGDRPSNRDRPPNVLLSVGRMGGGGVQTHIMLLCGLLRKSGSGVTLIGTHRGWASDEIKQVREMGVRLCVPPANLGGKGRFSRLYAMAALPLWMPRRGAGFTSVCFIGEGKYHRYLRWWISQTVPAIYHEVLAYLTPDNPRGRCALASNAVVANSRQVAAEFLPFIGDIPVRVIPFLTAGKPAPPPSPRLAARGRELRVVYIGRLAPQKRPDLLVREWQALTADSPLGPARLDVYGYDDGIRAADLNAFVAAAGTTSMVKIHGRYSSNQLETILATADLVVLPSLWEGLPLVLVEAMSRGVPVVTTNAGGSAELGEANADVIVTGTEWDSFKIGLNEMARRLREGLIDSVRLHQWTESKYGYDVVSAQWIDALLRPGAFFSHAGCGSPRHD